MTCVDDLKLLDFKLVCTYVSLLEFKQLHNYLCENLLKCFNF